MWGGSIPMDCFPSSITRFRAAGSQTDIPPPLFTTLCCSKASASGNRLKNWIPAESSPSKIAIFKLNHFPNHTLKLLPFLANSLQLIGTHASTDLEDADFSGAAPIPFCRFLHPSIHASVCSSLPSALWSSTREYRGHISNLNREIYKGLFFPPNACQKKWQVTELPNWPLSPFKNWAVHLGSWRMLTSAERPGSGQTEQSEIQRKSANWFVA